MVIGLLTRQIGRYMWFAQDVCTLSLISAMA